MHTKFFRILVKASKITQGAPNKVYRFVPNQDYTKESNIKWNNNIDEIDKQLFKIYKLDNKDIEYINDTLKQLEK